jgi:hypothetical protein
LFAIKTPYSLDGAARPPIQHINKASMEPALVVRVVAAAVYVLIQYVSIIAAQPRHFLLETNACTFHQHGRAALPEFAMPFNGAWYAVAVGLDLLLLYHFAIKRRQFFMPIDDFRSSISR